MNKSLHQSTSFAVLAILFLASHVSVANAQQANSQQAEALQAAVQQAEAQQAAVQQAEAQQAEALQAAVQQAEAQQAEAQQAAAQLVEAQTANAEEPVTAPDEPVQSGSMEQLVLNFQGTAWEDVLNWYAEQADLSLQIDRYPTGSVNYVDPTRSYSVDGTLDILNRLLLDRGYALVRRGRMLLLIDLEVDNAANLISELAELVSLDDLDGRSQSDIVSSVFPLGSLTPDAARQELAQLIGPWGRIIVLDSARQVKVTETVSKLLAIRKLLANAQETESNVVEIVLKYRGADEVLEIARPLLGLEDLQNSNESIRLSVGAYGERIYATGMPGKVSLLESIVSKADKPLATAEEGSTDEPSKPLFETHPVTVADSSTVFDVLQTLLAGTPDARIAIDPKTKSIVSYARPETQALIAATIAKLEGSGQEFKVINLRQLDPAQALLTINKFFGITETGGQGPIVDGDPSTNRLWIRGSADQIAMVEKLIGELEGNDVMGKLGNKVRMLPYNGPSGMDAFRQVQDVWSVLGRTNQIRTISPSSGSSNGSSETRAGIPDRRIHPDPQPAKRPSDEIPANDGKPDFRSPSESGSVEAPDFASVRSSLTSPTTLVAAQANESASANESATVAEGDPPSITLDFEGADIVVQFTPAGMIVASEDTEALDTFEALMESFAPNTTAQSDLPTIFWLKYAKADATAELISTIIGGVDSSLSSMGDSFSGGLGGGMLGLLGMGGGGGGGGGGGSTARSVLTSTGSISIVPDARLNALIVQANPLDLELVEMILRKLDIQESPEDIELIAKPALIPIIYQDAASVAEVVKSVFADRINGGTQSSGRGQTNPQEIIAALRGGGGGGRGGGGGGGGNRGGTQTTQSEPSKIVIAVDARSNSLVVTATPQDFEEVRQLVLALDEGGMQTEESVEVVTLKGNIKADVVRMALESVLGASTQTTTTGSTNSTSSNASSNDAARQAAMIRAMRQSAAGGRGGGGQTTGGRGGGGQTTGGRGGGGQTTGGRGGGGNTGGGRGGGGGGGR
ncbi:Bacterial type II/III secretion system short domain protein [Novipirellula aureliae]|uniref:Bacterial type II/III secretion system short domain protein n=1 Tax=Novipirellula aureliae TaxID=2527966 RepID=A0A5C6DR55_9BACT|nr:secretin N-terminal domain-containing protein [Novipirellula aureliae]TWU39132.1 Bacterial type II/III secretion system short domain protein [Novipirellula aureliae]